MQNLVPLLVMPEEREMLREMLRDYARNLKGLEFVGGGGLTVRRLGNRVSFNAGRGSGDPAMPGSSKMIAGLITGNAAGNGKYVGKSFTDGAADVAASGSLAESDNGTLATTNDCLILNLAELGSSTTGHDVTATTNLNQFAIYFVGRLLWTNTDGTKVVQVYMPYAGCA